MTVSIKFSGLTAIEAVKIAGAAVEAVGTFVTEQMEVEEY